jgi:predicted nuclease with TOPRIM domain
MDDLTKVTYWLDLIVKGIIGIFVTLVGMDYKQVKTSLQELQESKYKLSTQVEIVQVEIKGFNSRLDRIETKLDQIIEKRK